MTLVDRSSTSGFFVFLRAHPISWVAKKQSTVSQSSTEAEYRSLATTAVELFWIRQLLQDLHIFSSQPHALWCVNIAIINRAKNPVFHGRTKHIEIDFHFICEYVVHQDISLNFNLTASQLADLFTKLLAANSLLFLKSKLMPLSTSV